MEDHSARVGLNLQSRELVLTHKDMMQARERLIDRRKSRRVAVTGGHAAFFLVKEGENLQKAMRSCLIYPSKGVD